MSSNRAYPGAPVEDMVRFVRSGELGELALMLEAGADPNALCGTEKTPLMIAAQEDNLAAVELLLALTDPNIVGISGYTALLCAADRSPEVLLRLLAVSDPRAVADGARTALMMAARAGRVENVAMLLPVSDVGARDDEGRDALFFATSWGTENAGHDGAACAIQAWIERSELSGLLPGARSSSRRPGI